MIVCRRRSLNQKAGQAGGVLSLRRTKAQDPPGSNSAAARGGEGGSAGDWGAGEEEEEGRLSGS